jgi:hypothetical protein
MLEQLFQKQIVKDHPPFPLPVEEGKVIPTTIEDYVVSKFAATGRTVMVTRWGDAPIVSYKYYDEARDIDVVCTVITEKELRQLVKRSKEIKPRLQLLQDVPITHFIIGHEVPTEEQVALALKKKENAHEGARIFGEVGFTIAAVAVGIVVGLLSVVFRTAVQELCNTRDPILWARTPNGAWILVASWYE